MILAIALLAPGCFEDLQHPSDVVADQLVDGAVHIGALLPLSEGGGLSQRDAVRMAAEDASAVGPHTIAVVVADSRPERIAGLDGVDTEVRRRLELLRRAGAPAVVVADDGAAVTARRFGDSRGPVVMSYAASSDAPFEVLRGAPTFRLGPPDSVLGPALAALASRGPQGTAVLAVQGDPFGVGLRAAVESALADSGRTVVQGAWLDPRIQGGQPERVAPVLARSPSTIVLALPAGIAAAVINEALPRSQGIDWVLAPTVVSPAFLDNVADPQALDGALAIAPATGSRFASRFLERTGRAPAPNDSLAYDAVRLLASAAALTGLDAPTGRDLARELPGLDHAGEYTQWRLLPDGRADADHPLQVFRFDAATRSFFPDARTNSAR
jgi:ABC-type branched-subunit amino acid transport system substrate-binding protein